MFTSLYKHSHENVTLKQKKSVDTGFNGFNNNFIKVIFKQ